MDALNAGTEHALSEDALGMTMGFAQQEET